MKIYDLHIVSRLLRAYVLLILVLCVFFVLLHYVEFIDDFMSKGATQSQVFFYYYPNYLFEIVKLVSPLALFLAAVFLTARLAQELFVAAMLQNGVSLYRLFAPYLAVGVIVTVVMIGFNGYVVPITQKNVVDFEGQYFKKQTRRIDTSHLQRQNSRDGVVSLRYYDPTQELATRVSLIQFGEDQSVRRRTDAHEMQWVDSLSIWRLSNVVERTFHADGGVERTRRTQLDTVLNVLPRDLARTERDVEMLTIPAAREYLASLERSGVDQVGQQWVQYYIKYAFPASNLVLVVIAFPFAAVRRRRGQAVQLGLALLMAFVYFSVMKVIEPFGYAETVPALVAAWLPHVLFLAMGGVMLFRAHR